MRASLQETVLHIALLAQGASIPEVHAWRARCIGLVERLEQAMRDDGRTSDVVRDVGIAQCMLLDDVTLRHLPAGRRSEWLRETLLFRFHRVHGDVARPGAQIDVLLNGPGSESSLLNLYTAVLGLGPSHERNVLRACLSTAYPPTSPDESGADDAASVPAKPSSEPASSIAAVAAAARAWRPLRPVLFATVMLAAVWIFTDVSLRRAVERLPDSGPRVAQNGDGGRQ
ncbi:DotU family type IV/VI secretion system protein [Burkholderia sola]|uniref:DotU family type IV/VI secretion system protein n=1 Tax=Burkholderia sola TaxID=2843302 RepID=UPI00338D43AD